MIVDNIQNAARYEALHPGFAAAFAFLKSHMETPYSEGRHEIADGVYAMVSHYETEDPSSLQYEGHRDYLDIQFLGSGEELLGYANISQMQPKTQYDAQNDFLLFDGAGLPVKMQRGTFVILYPEDIHRPKGMSDQKCAVEKIVVKVKL